MRNRSTTPPAIDLDKQSPESLRSLRRNYLRAGLSEKVVEVVIALYKQRKATARDFKYLRWNDGRVAEVLVPFKEIAEAVPGNKRKSYSVAGRRRIHTERDDPDYLWIDSYSAIKSGATNAVFGCHIKSPISEPIFQLTLNNEVWDSYEEINLEKALSDWRQIAEEAAAQFRAGASQPKRKRTASAP